MDHLKKQIHRQQFAGDSCGFLSTPVEKREFTNSQTHILQLKQKEFYKECPYCQSAQMLTKKEKNG